MKSLYCCFILFLTIRAGAQELYVYAEPASTNPAKALNIKLSANYIPDQSTTSKFTQRYTPEVAVGLSKDFTLRAAGAFANMNTAAFKWEAVYLNAKYRIVSNDDLHRHFRMAVFAEGSYSQSPFNFEEINLEGDKSGVEIGVIATQLWNRFAISSAVGHVQALHGSRSNKNDLMPSRIYQAMNYSVSAGYLLLPKAYTDYRQTNVNLYLELLGQQSLERQRYFVDIAPALQFIFNSRTRVNAGYRWEVAGRMDRMTRNSWQISIEHTLLNALSRK